MTTAESTVVCQGWELCFEGDGSDKFYRLIYVEHDENYLVITNYGRNGTNGQVRCYSFPSRASALAEIASITDQKAGKGYVVSRDFTEFHPSLELVKDVHRNHEGGKVFQVIQSFVKSSDAAGTRFRVGR